MGDRAPGRQAPGEAHDPFRPRCGSGRPVTRILASASFSIAILLAAGCGTEAGLGPPYPSQIVAPEVIGLVESVTTESDQTIQVELVGGQELILGPQDRELQGGTGALILFGTQPERWYLGVTFNGDLDCYRFSADRAFSEPDSVVLAFGRWLGVGIRLAKAPGFDDSRLVTRNSEGRMEFQRLAGVAFCADAQGRISGM
jgi:hypothetical protein